MVTEYYLELHGTKSLISLCHQDSIRSISPIAFYITVIIVSQIVVNAWTLPFVGPRVLILNIMYKIYYIRIEWLLRSRQELQNSVSKYGAPVQVIESLTRVWLYPDMKAITRK